MSKFGFFVARSLSCEDDDMRFRLLQLYFGEGKGGEEGIANTKNVRH